MSIKTFIKEYNLYIVWVIAALSMIGSLYFQYVLQLPPCVLCWYQRIAMYPIALLLPIAIIRGDRSIARYLLPLSIVGLVIAIYHNLLYYHVLPESIAPCTTGISCTTRQIELFGFITIPLLSLSSFIIITAALLWYRKVQHDQRS
jgi:disulfide bond formation protein DsbB